MERSTVLELSSGLMAHLTSVNFTTIIFTAKVFTHGQIIENMRANGEPIKCMVKVHLLGQMEESTLENMPKTRKRVTENLFGQMADATEVNGSMENNMEKEPT
jgi:hypothetical protein